MEWFNKIIDFLGSIGEFFVLVWEDEDRWLLIGGMLFFFIGFIVCTVITLHDWFSTRSTTTSTSSVKRNKVVATSTGPSNKMIVTIKGVYQMNGPKTFIRNLTIYPSESSYYSQLMGNKRKQAQWIQANFPGADTDRGFSMSINIKK